MGTIVKRKRELARIRDLKTSSLLDFIPKISPRYSSPRHLAPLADALEEAFHGEPIRSLNSTPPQHGKSETIEHAIARDLLAHPEKLIAYATYSQRKARESSLKIRDYALAAGVELRRGSESLDYWCTPQGGGLLATSVGGALTGYPGLKLIIIDDPIKNREEAESSLVRDNLHSWFSSAVVSRVHPDTGIIIVATRWHWDDLIGRLMANEYLGEQRWSVVNLPAIDGEGNALWPEARPIAFLESIRDSGDCSPYDWSALYMGHPVPRGSAVFGPEATYKTPPTTGIRIGGGLDLAYTSKTRSDWNVAVIMAREFGPDPDRDRYFVLEVRRAQSEASAFHADVIEKLEDTYKGICFRAYLATSEMGSGQFMRRLGTDVDLHRAKVDKYQRAQPVAAAWAAGRILVPLSAPWLAAFLGEIQKFTGVGDKHDDQVDALAAAFDLLAKKPVNAKRPRLHLAVPFEQRSIG
jgi:predicted phage terminase large subunit-like protein